MGRVVWYSDLRDSVQLKNPVARKSLLTSARCIELSHWSDGSFFILGALHSLVLLDVNHPAADIINGRSTDCNG